MKSLALLAVLAASAAPARAAPAPVRVWVEALARSPSLLSGAGLGPESAPAVSRVLERTAEFPALPASDAARSLALKALVREEASSAVLQAVQGARLREVSAAAPLSQALYLQDQLARLSDLKSLGGALSPAAREALGLALASTSLRLEAVRSRLDVSELASAREAGLFAPPREANAEARVVLNAREPLLLLASARYTDWTPHLGKLVGVEFRGLGEPEIVPQIPLAGAVLGAAARDSVARLLAASPRSPLQFQETGLFAIRTPRRTYRSRLFTSGDFGQIAGKKLFEAFNRMVGFIFRHADEDGTFLDLSFFHTHPGKGTPLSPADLRVIETVARASGLGPEQSAHIYAAPIENRGELVFKTTVEP